jgi:hypothetical protein
MKHRNYILLALAVIGSVMLLASCKPRGAGPSLSKELSEPPAPAAQRPTAKQIADESLAKALASPPAQNGMRLATYCPVDEAMATDDCFQGQVTAELIGDIGRRIRQGAGVLTVEAAPEPSADQTTADCARQTTVLAFKLVPMNVFPKGAIRPMLNSLCYSIVSQTKLTDCQCLGNIRKTLAGLAAEAKAKGAVLAILDARRFGAWESAPAEQDAATIDSPGFDLVYALIPKPKDFDAIAPIDFVSAEKGQAAAGGVGVTVNEAPPLRIELPDADATAAPAVTPAANTSADAQSDVKKSESKSDAKKSGSKDKSKKKSKKKNKGKTKTKDKDKDQPQTTDKQTGAATQ